MSIQCYTISSDKRIQPCEADYAVQLSGEPQGNVWIDVQASGTEEIEDLMVKLRMSALVKRLCVEAKDRAGFYPLKDLIFIVLPVQEVDTDLHEMEYVTLICRGGLLLTLRDSKYSRLQQITTIQESAEWLGDNTIGGFISVILFFLSLETLQRLSGLRRDIITVEKQMDKDPLEVDQKDLSEKRTRLLVFEAIVSSQVPVFQALLATDKPYFKSDSSREHLSNALANLEAADRSLQWLGGRIDVIRGDLEMISQDQTNRRLGRLTVLSVIFMPLTFLAGIWGMNFEHMPELSHPKGYSMALGSMILLGTGLFFYFKKKGWFN